MAGPNNQISGDIELYDGVSPGPRIIRFDGDPNGLPVIKEAGTICLDKITPATWRSNGDGTWEKTPAPVAEAQLVVGSIPTTIVAPNNAISDNNNFLAGNAQIGVVAPNAGTYILTTTFLIQANVTA